MARRIRNANPVTLFPFLAVLMCTIGALVLLLVVISAQIRGSAVQQFVAEQKKKSEPARPVEVPPPVVEESVADPEPIHVESIVVEVELVGVAHGEPAVVRRIGRFEESVGAFDHVGCDVEADGQVASQGTIFTQCG